MYQTRYYYKFAYAVLTFGAVLAGEGLALAQQQEVDAEPARVNRVQPVAVPEPRRTKPPGKVSPPAAASLDPPPILDGTWTFGGAVRARGDANFDSTDARTGAPAARSYFGFDTLILKAAYDSSTVFGAAQYRFYGGAYPYTREAGYKGTFGEFNFLQFAYAGIKLTPQDSVSVGIQQVPFGLTPYFSTTFYETVGFVMGVEEVYKTGIKYSHVEENFNYQLAYFPADGGNYFGISRDASRYSTNIVKADSYVAGGTNNAEQQMLVGRSEYTFCRTPDMTATIGASVWHSRIYNYDTTLFGSKQQEAIHFVGTYGPWTFRALGARIDIDPKNPGGRNGLITVGSYDGSYNVATKGFFISGDLAYNFTPQIGPFTEIVPYLNYSAFYKDRADFKDTERYIVGTAWTVRAVSGLYIYTEFRFGRNDPYTGAGQYTQGLGTGGDNKFKTSFNMNIGYYF